jgi:5-formyltetrahydrofolate cyclo-ligase
LLKEPGGFMALIKEIKLDAVYDFMKEQIQKNRFKIITCQSQKDICKLIELPGEAQTLKFLDLMVLVDKNFAKGFIVEKEPWF